MIISDDNHISYVATDNTQKHWYPKNGSIHVSNATQNNRVHIAQGT